MQVKKHQMIALLTLHFKIAGEPTVVNLQMYIGDMVPVENIHMVRIATITHFFIRNLDQGLGNLIE